MSTSKKHNTIPNIASEVARRLMEANAYGSDGSIYTLTNAAGERVKDATTEIIATALRKALGLKTKPWSGDPEEFNKDSEIVTDAMAKLVQPKLAKIVEEEVVAAWPTTEVQIRKIIRAELRRLGGDRYHSAIEREIRIAINERVAVVVDEEIAAVREQIHALIGKELDPVGGSP